MLAIPLFIILHKILLIYLAAFPAFSLPRFFIPSKLAIIPDLVGRDKLLIANALSDTTHMIGNVVGLVVGAITAPVFNDIPALIKRYPGIRAIFCNGAASYLVWKKRYADAGLPFIYLPSTSCANAGHSYAHKRQGWKKILRILL